MVNINPPSPRRGANIYLCNEKTRAQFILSTGHSGVMWLYKVSFSSLTATCVKKDVTNEGKSGDDQIHEKSKER
jgi:hypothetical protein